MSDKHSDSYSDSGKELSKDLDEEESIKDLDKELSKEPEPLKPPKGKRGRKIKYLTDEERIEARRTQQKEYRERKKVEMQELRARIDAVEKALRALQKE